MENNIKNETSSFRDPSGFIFNYNDKLYRQINKIYKDNYHQLVESNLLELLFKKNLLIKHEEVDLNYKKGHDFYKTIKPEKIPFISYPYEWSFNQLKDAALLTLKIQKLALEHNMTLKDASAYNVQFLKTPCLLKNMKKIDPGLHINNFANIF